MAVQLTLPVATHGGLNWDTNLEANLLELSNKANYTDQAVSGADLNTIVKSGGYYTSGNSVTSPNGTGNGFITWDLHRSDGAAAAQIAVNVNIDGAVYMRRYSGGWQPWFPITTNAPAWVTASTGITAGANWTLTSTKYRNLNGVVSLAISVTRTTSATAAASAAGILTGVTLATLPAGLAPANANGLLQTVGVASTVAGAAQVTTAGVVNLTNLAPGQTVPVGGVLDLMGTYFL